MFRQILKLKKARAAFKVGDYEEALRHAVDSTKIKRGPASQPAPQVPPNPALPGAAGG